jgi:hypothetical protein
MLTLDRLWSLQYKSSESLELVTSLCSSGLANYSVIHFLPSTSVNCYPMRALTLHVSALNDAEYDTYTDALNDLTTDGKHALTSDQYYDKVKVGVREVRAWLRGRFSTVPITDIDSVSLSLNPSVAALTITDTQTLLPQSGSRRCTHGQSILCCYASCNALQGRKRHRPGSGIHSRSDSQPTLSPPSKLTTLP